jgi:hypothetical protein
MAIVIVPIVSLAVVVISLFVSWVFGGRSPQSTNQQTTDNEKATFQSAVSTHESARGGGAEDLRKVYFPPHLQTSALSTAASQSITAHFIGDTGYLAVPARDYGLFLNAAQKDNLPIDTTRAVLDDVKRMREKISRVIAQANRGRYEPWGGGPYGKALTRELVQGWHDDLVDIENRHS